jgi:Bacterial extracellular solute-binding proteins, family 5 Middle
VGPASTPSKPILPGPLAKLDIKDAKLEAARGTPKGTLNIGMHFGLDPGWLDPLGYYGPAFHFYYLVHDALIKPMPQGEFTYSLAEHAEMTADFTKAAFRLRPGLKFQDGHPLTTTDVMWTYDVPFVPYFDMAERILTDRRAVGIRAKLQMLDAPAYMAHVSQGRKSFPGNRTIVQTIDPRPGGAKASIRLYAVCGGQPRRSTSIPSCTPSAPKSFRRVRPCTTTGTRSTLPSRGPGRSGR